MPTSKHGMDKVYVTPLRRTVASSPYCECARRHQQRHAGSKILLPQNPSSLNWGHCLTQTDLHNGRKMAALPTLNLLMVSTH